MAMMSTAVSGTLPDPKTLTLVVVVCLEMNTIIYQNHAIHTHEQVVYGR